MVTPGQLSDAVTVKLTSRLLEGGQEAAVVVMFPGQVIEGACVSLTFRVNVHEAMLLADKRRPFLA